MLFLAESVAYNKLRLCGRVRETLIPVTADVCSTIYIKHFGKGDDDFQLSPVSDIYTNVDSNVLVNMTLCVTFFASISLNKK